MSMELKVLDSHFKEFCEPYNNRSESELFELFSAQCSAVGCHLDNDSLEKSLIGGSRDGGIDWILITLDDQAYAPIELVDEDENSKPFLRTDGKFTLSKGSKLKIIIGQAKTSESFNETVGHKFHTTFSQVFTDPSEIAEDTWQHYNNELRKAVGAIWVILLEALKRGVNCEVALFYTTRAVGDASEGVTKVLEAAALEAKKKLGASNYTIHTWGAAQLREAYQTSPDYNATLKYFDELDSGRAKVALIRLYDYYKFITKEGRLLAHYFEYNVRDFQGANKEVNSEILNTLNDTESNLDFWWLNNGVTILVSESPSSTQKTYLLKNVQIVNGLQTSYMIYEHFQGMEPEQAEQDSRCILVRILVPGDIESDESDKIIRSTNNQTTIPTANLRATDPIHRHIENVLKTGDLYYDRRKSYWRNKKVALKKIVTISELGQGILSCYLFRPDDARARPSSFIKDDKRYEEIFHNRKDEDFLWAASALKKVKSTLASSPYPYVKTNANNLTFYIVFLLKILEFYQKTGIVRLAALDGVAQPDFGNQTDEAIEAVTYWTYDTIDDFCKTKEITIDKACKGAELKTHLLEKLQENEDTLNCFLNAKEVSSGPDAHLALADISITWAQLIFWNET